MANFNRSFHSYYKSLKSLLYRFSVASILSIFFTLLLFVSVPSPVLSAEETYWQSVIPFFQANDYEGAYNELEKLLKTRPDNPLLLRLQGVCLFELDQFDLAAKILERSVNLDPDSIASRYYYAQALAYRGSLLMAIDILNEVIQLAPESEYAQKSLEILPKIKNLAGSISAVKDYQRWNVYGRTAWEYDDNVPTRANNSTVSTPQDSWIFAYSLYGEYRLLDQKHDKSPFSLGGGYSIDGNVHSRESFQVYDLFSQKLSLFLSHSNTLWDKFYTARVQGSYNYSLLDSEDYSRIGSLEGNFSYYWHNKITSDLVLGWNKRNFDWDSEFPEYYSRDGDAYKIGIRNYLYLMDNRLILGLHYMYRRVDTDGMQYDVRSNDLTGSFDAYLPMKFRLNGSISYQQEDYTEFTPNPKRLDNVWTLNIALQRKIWREWLTLEANYSYTTADSNLDFAEYRRNTVGIALSVSY